MKYNSLTVRFAYALQGLKSYRTSKHFFYSLMETNKHTYSIYFNALMISLIFISVAILINEVKHDVLPSLIFFNDIIISSIFLLEYLLRLWLHSSITSTIIRQYEKDQFLNRKLNKHAIFKKVLFTKFSYIKSPTAIIDLLAILPFFHQLRLLRLFILFRVFKLFRYARSIQTFLKVLRTKEFEFLTLFIFTSIIVFVSAVMIYVMEANVEESKINTLFEAFYWSLVTISTVGFGDYYPVTDAGRIVAMVIIISGIGVISFATSIIVSSFTEQLDDIKENRHIDKVNKLNKFYLILGYDYLGEHVANKLKKLGNTIVVLDEREHLILLAKRDGHIAFNYNPGLLSSYKRLNINFSDQIKSILTLQSSDIANVYNTLTIRSLHKKAPILSILHNESNRKKLELAGVNHVIFTQELIGMVAKEFGGEPVAFEAIHAFLSENEQVIFEEIFITDFLCENYAHIKALHLHHYHLQCLGIQKKAQEFIFNPENSVTLSSGDVMIIFGLKSLVLEFKKQVVTHA